MKKSIRELAEREALEIVLSDTKNVTYRKLVADLDKAGWDSIPERYLVWEPFESMAAGEFLELVEQFADQFERFAAKLGGE